VEGLFWMRYPVAIHEAVRTELEMRWWRRAMNQKYGWGDTAGAGMIWDGNRRQVCLRSRGDLLCRKEQRIPPAFIGRMGACMPLFIFLLNLIQRGMQVMGFFPL